MRPSQIAVLGLCLMLGGCQYVAVQSGQLSSAISLFSLESNELLGPPWAVQYGGYSATIQTVTSDKTTVFVNDSDTIYFDGWLISKVMGLSSFTPAWEIQDSDGVRSFAVNGQIVATHQCAPWSSVVLEDLVQYQQECVGDKAYINKILVNGMGQIVAIEQVVDSSFKVLKLRFDN
ncbi:hypothetical protein N9X74_02230 [Porticoccaceae bacterium]|nr:hypothetical protein [Porticoccaceae bacterium]